MKKHAYLIMAHDDNYTLVKLLESIDDQQNDIFLHLDKKNKALCYKDFENVCNKSKLHFIERKKIFWGSYKQIDCEIRLLKKAVETDKYIYYHLLSGSDLPIKSQKEIHDFFNKNQGKEFVHFCDDNMMKRCHCYERLKYYTFFQGQIKNKSIMIRALFRAFNSISIHLQMILKVDRNKKLKNEIGFGANWFSISDSLAKYVLSKEDWIRKKFKYTRCADEMFLQTLVLNSDYFNHVYIQDKDDSLCAETIKRKIDWTRGSPYIYTKDDYKELITCNCLFARKFNSEIDKEIIDKLVMNLSRSR